MSPPPLPTDFFSFFPMHTFIPHWHSLHLKEKNHLLHQINSIDWNTLKFQRQLISSIPKPSHFSALEGFYHAGNTVNKKLGERLLSEGKVGCLILAGGEASRLGISYPKGCYPISLYHNTDSPREFFQIGRAHV